MAQQGRRPPSPEIAAEYRRRIEEVEERGNAREESYYSCLEELLSRFAAATGRDVHVTTLPRRQEGGLPDFQVWRGRHRIVGYVEAKRPGTALDPVEASEQMGRYRAAFPNLVLTNFRELRLFRRGRRVFTAQLEGSTHGAFLGQPGNGHGAAGLYELLGLFLDAPAFRSTGARDLAVRLAGRARILAGAIEEMLAADPEGTSDLAGFYAAFSEHLIRGLSRREFAGLYAQTIAYGLLAARWQAPGELDRHRFAENVPRAGGILRDVFQVLSLDEPRPAVAWIVDDIVDLLAAAPVRRLLERYFHGGKGREDPILHFYETFLRELDPKTRARRGVYYTPEPVARYVVRSIDHLLRTRLGRPRGLATPGVTLLDPAAGTLTFVAEAFRCAVGTVREEMGEGAVAAFLRDQLVPASHAFELMMAPYAIAHLKMASLLAEEGVTLAPGQRLNLFLTNALELRELEQSNLPGMSSLSRESRAAGSVKRDLPATVVLGNPPWSGTSANHDPDFDKVFRQAYEAADGRRIPSYFELDGKPLGERNPKWLCDDYVKFLRFAQWKIDRAGEGVVGFVTNHGWLDNPTFRGLRRSLMESFEEIRVLDLHGSSKKGERGPGGAPDENVFDVRQGVAIVLLVKRPGLARRVLRADLWGRRAEKLAWLTAHHAGTTEWTPLEPPGPAVHFAPRDRRLAEEYGRGVPVPEIFPERSVGVVTARDAFAVAFGRAELAQRVGVLRGGLFGPEHALHGLGLADRGSFRVAEAARRTAADADWQAKLLPFLYRPFDLRWVLYADYVVERMREPVMRHLLAGENLALVVPRQHKEEPGALATRWLTGHKAVSAYDVNTVFPLYLYRPGLFAAPVPNLGEAFLRRLARQVGEVPAPEAVFGYVYAVLYSRRFRGRYEDLLRRDFPRIPLPPDRRLFEGLAAVGGALAGLHLLRPEGGAPRVQFPVRGSGLLGEGNKLPRDYRPAERRVVVNEEGQCFTGIEPAAWEYRVGGYQVLDRWLKDRAGRLLAAEEIEHFCRAATAIHRTLELERSVDALFAELERLAA